MLLDRKVLPVLRAPPVQLGLSVPKDLLARLVLLVLKVLSV